MYIADNDFKSWLIVVQGPQSKSVFGNADQAMDADTRIPWGPANDLADKVPMRGEQIVDNFWQFGNRRDCNTTDDEHAASNSRTVLSTTWWQISRSGLHHRHPTNTSRKTCRPTQETTCDCGHEHWIRRLREFGASKGHEHPLPPVSQGCKETFHVLLVFSHPKVIAVTFPNVIPC